MKPIVINLNITAIISLSHEKWQGEMSLDTGLYLFIKESEPLPATQHALIPSTYKVLGKFYRKMSETKLLVIDVLVPEESIEFN